jgi:hypothetical protein
MVVKCFTECRFRHKCKCLLAAGQLEHIFYVCKPVGTAYSNGTSKEGRATDGQMEKLSVSLTMSLVWCITVTWIFRCDSAREWTKSSDNMSSLINVEHQPDELKMHSQLCCKVHLDSTELKGYVARPG